MINDRSYAKGDPSHFRSYFRFDRSSSLIYQSSPLYGSEEHVLDILLGLAAMQCMLQW